ncbi:MAG: homoserine kinase [Gammaproteobacteria bacterium]
MSVYTRVEPQQLKEFLLGYPLGELVTYAGVSAGIENTNYFVTTTEGEFVLTLFESTPYQHLPYFLDLMAFLAEHGVPSAHPLADRQGRYLTALCGKPAALVRRLKGSDVREPGAAHCAALGKALGHLHRVGVSFSGRRDNDRGPVWREATARKVLPCLNPEDAALLREELHYQKQNPCRGLPQGVIHADLFRDNALFVDSELTGIIDFYYACNDILLYDVAVTVNDWCSDASGALDTARLNRLLDAYVIGRPFIAAEHAAWPVMLRAAALRFWLSRLHDLHFPRRGEITHTKDPEVFKRILRERQHAIPALSF